MKSVETSGASSKARILPSAASFKAAFKASAVTGFSVSNTTSTTETVEKESKPTAGNRTEYSLPGKPETEVKRTIQPTEKLLTTVHSKTEEKNLPYRVGIHPAKPTIPEKNLFPARKWITPACQTINQLYRLPEYNKYRSRQQSCHLH